MSLSVHAQLTKLANDLDPLPQTVVRLNTLFATDDYDMKDVIQTINLDPTLAANVLRLANSAAIGTVKTSSLLEAATRLGAGTVRSLAMISTAKPQKDSDLSCFGLTPDSYWEHCVRVLCFAEVLLIRIDRSLLDRSFRDDFTSAALLHDFGKLILAKYIKPQQLTMFQQQPAELPPTERELSAFDIDHPEVGAVVCERWNLRKEMAKAIQYHHKPMLDDSLMGYGLNLANFLARQVEAPKDLHSHYTDMFELSMATLSLSQEQLDVVRREGDARFHVVKEVYQ